VVASAWIPWLLPMQRVYLCFFAILIIDLDNSSKPPRIIKLDWESWMEKAVSSISLEVNPLWIKRDSGPTYFATFVRKAMTSCFVFNSILSISLTLNLAFF